MTYKIAGEWVIGHIGEEGFDPDNKLLGIRRSCESAQAAKRFQFQHGLWPLAIDHAAGFAAR